MPFRFIKFRTMVVGAETHGAGILCLKDDPRVTAVGRLLRRSSMDELPQLFNVLRGEMSVVGPRPGLAYQVKEYTPEQRRRLTVLPGITGWAQVNGRNAISWDERIKRDIEYVERLSLRMDLLVLRRTLGAIVRSDTLIAEKDHFKEKAAKSVVRPQKVVIIGAGDHGRGTLEILREASRHGGAPEVVGFLDDSPLRRGALVGGLPVLGGLEWVPAEPQPDLGYVIGIADTRAKQRIAQRLSDRPITFVSAVHPSLITASGVRIAPGAIINAGVAIAYDAVIEEHTTVNLHSTIGHDCVLGRCSTVAPGANIAGRVRLGEGCDIGVNATIGKGLEIGEWSSVGPGAVVVRSVAPGQHVFGNPARVVLPLARRSHAS